jgi:NAD(P)-dependent dehydrogenase (short-subunit alcohol dehydrogenase family)
MSAPVVLVTGGSRGIGAATALLAAERGYRVAIAYAKDAGAADRVLAAVREKGGEGLAIRCDVASESDVLALFETVDRSLGCLTHLVNNAGIVGPASRLADADIARIERVVAVDLVGAMIVAREAVRRMAKSRGGEGGVIVNVSSMAAVHGGANEFVWYAAAKGGIDSFTIGLSREVAPEGIRVNAVSPGMIDTEIQVQGGDPGRAARFLPVIPLARLGTADEVAEAILWLMSDAASYVTGAVLRVSGGR